MKIQPPEGLLAQGPHAVPRTQTAIGSNYACDEAFAQQFEHLRDIFPIFPDGGMIRWTVRLARGAGLLRPRTWTKFRRLSLHSLFPLTPTGGSWSSTMLITSSGSSVGGASTVLTPTPASAIASTTVREPLWRPTPEGDRTSAQNQVWASYLAACRPTYFFCFAPQWRAGRLIAAARHACATSH